MRAKQYYILKYSSLDFRCFCNNLLVYREFFSCRKRCFREKFYLFLDKRDNLFEYKKIVLYLHTEKV